MQEVERLTSLLKSIKIPNNSALSFSGGLDSGLLAFLFEDVKLYTVGLENSKDVKNALELADILGREVEIIPLEDRHIIEGAIFLKRIQPDITPLEISFDLPLYIVLSEVNKRNVITGQGADELFGGYSKYLREPERMQDDLKTLLERTLPRERKMASLLLKELITPYLDERIIKFASTIPIEMKIKDGVRKWVLREAAKELGAPMELWSREKKAAQYGSGVWKMIKRMTKERGMDVESFLKSL
jgi:asparagine synthase (glutamine-hydrolysing)